MIMFKRAEKYRYITVDARRRRFKQKNLKPFPAEANGSSVKGRSAAFTLCADSVNGPLKRTYTITERRVPGLIPVLGSQPAGDVRES